MRLLFVAARLPSPPWQGDRLRAYHQIRLLSHRHAITLVAPMRHPAERRHVDDVARFCQAVELVPAPAWRGVLRLVSGLWRDLPWQTIFFSDPQIARRVRTLTQSGRFDLAHIQLARLAPIAEALAPVPCVLDFIDALSLNMLRRAEREARWRAWPFYLEAARLRRYERRLVRGFARTLVTSEIDRAAIDPQADIRVIPNGVDLERYAYSETGRSAAMCIFTGRMSYFPNADAARYLVDTVWPRVRARRPAAQLVLAGAEPPPAIRRLATRPGVVVTGTVADLRPLLSRATLAVAPLRSGSGIQNKVLEAMACGTPVVATSAALAGLQVEAGSQALVADNPDLLATEILRLLDDPGLRVALARRARRLVEQTYSWDGSVEKLEQVYAEVSESRLN